MERAKEVLNDPVFLGVFACLAYRHLFSAHVHTSVSSILLLCMLAAAVAMIVDNTDSIDRLFAWLDPHPILHSPPHHSREPPSSHWPAAPAAPDTPTAPTAPAVPPVAPILPPLAAASSAAALVGALPSPSLALDALLRLLRAGGEDNAL